MIFEHKKILRLFFDTKGLEITYGELAEKISPTQKEHIFPLIRENYIKTNGDPNNITNNLILTIGTKSEEIFKEWEAEEENKKNKKVKDDYDLRISELQIKNMEVAIKSSQSVIDASKNQEEFNKTNKQIGERTIWIAKATSVVFALQLLVSAIQLYFQKSDRAEDRMDRKVVSA